MKTKYFLVILLSLVLTTLTGCRTSPVYNIEDQYIATNIDNPALEDIKKAIIRGGGSQGWKMNADQPGHVIATLYIRKHIAKVDITYNLKKYSITYKDSTNLKYEAQGSQGSSDTGSIKHSLRESNKGLR